MQSANVPQLQSLIGQAARSVQGSPGKFSLVHLGGRPTAPAPIPFAPSDAQLITDSIRQANAAAVQTPSAAAGTPVGGNTPQTAVQGAVTNVIQDLGIIAQLVKDFVTFEQGATATLSWWGWTLELTHESAQALAKLFTTDQQAATGIFTAAALVAISAPVAAVAAIIGVAVSQFGDWIKTEDQGKGVTVTGYLFVGIDVTTR